MKVEIEFGGKTRTVEVTPEARHTGARLRCRIDGRDLEADAVEISPGTYSILIGGASLEARVEPAGEGLRVTVAGREYAAAIRNPRKWRGGRGAAFQTEGRQNVVAPMPGKVIRLLVKTGEQVEAGQGIAVVEAMKMQNEVRSPKSGVVERLLVSENQTVGSGETLAVVA